MRRQVLLDTGTLVALIDRNEQHYSWMLAELKTIQPPLLTCEAVLSETWFLLQRVNRGYQSLIGLLNNQSIQIPFRLDEETSRVTELLIRYQSVPMSLADACLVRMAEQYSESHVLTLDSDFQIYRKDTNQVIPVIMPGG